MAIFILLFLIFFNFQLLQAETRSHGIFRKRPQAEEVAHQAEIPVTDILEQFSNPQFEELKEKERRLRNEITDLVNGLVLQSSDVLDQKTEAIKRALEQEKERVRNQLRTVQSKIKSQITEKMKRLGFQSTGMGTTTFIKGNRKIHIRFAEGQFEIQTFD